MTSNSPETLATTLLAPKVPATGTPASREVFQATLANCAREPIHTPGSVQPLGALLTFSTASGIIKHASTNLGQWLQLETLPAMGRSLSDLLGAEAYAHIEKALTRRPGGTVRYELVDLPARLDAGQPLALKAIVHTHRSVSFVELEPQAAVYNEHLGLQALSDTIDALRSATSLEDMIERMAQRVKRLVKFDRVMVYRFDEQNNGHVVADAREPEMESFYDLHYPASDIPAQARELYLNNLMRYIPDVGYTPVPVLPWLDTERLQPLDMSHASLRSVSPMHIQYLQNMGVASTLVLSILVDGQLWGLIACHHRTPTLVPLQLRQACRALAVTAGYMTGWFTSQARFAAQAETNHAQVAIVEAFNQVQASLEDVIEHCSASLLRIAGATGGAFWSDEQLITFGQWPELAGGKSILSFVRHALETTLQALVELEQAQVEPTLADADPRIFCGLLAIKFDGFASAGIVWLRPEFRREVLWGGDPDKPVVVEIEANGQPKLVPRESFARWSREVHGKCRPWSKADREAVLSLAVLRQVLVVRESLAQVSLSDLQFRSLVALQSDAYWKTDHNGIISTMSKALPFKTGSLQNRHLLTMLSEAFGENEAEVLRSSLVSRRAFRNMRMHAVRGRHQRDMVIELNGEPLKDIMGNFCGWHGTLTDVTSLDKIQVALREKDVEIRGTLRSLAEGVVVQDADGRIMEWNPAALTILGLTAEQISWRSSFDLEWHAIDVQGNDLPGDQHPAIIALATGEVQQQVVMGIDSPGRSRRWLSVNAVPLIFEEKVTRVVTSFRDITMEMDSKKELRELNQELEMRVVRRTAALEAAGKNLKESLVALEARALAQQRLIYILSHDLREPLNAIINFTGVLTKSQHETLSAAGNKSVSFISASAVRMKMLLDDLLKFVRLEAGNVSPVDISLDDLLKEIQEDMHDSMDKAGAVLVVNAPVTVTGDRTLIRILLQNLVANAIKFVPPDRVPHLSISATADEQACVITVKDNGIGIPDDSLDRIFDLFARLNHRSQFEGTGLGLAICRRIVEMHHGNITVYSELNLGSTFIVTLPLAFASIERNL